MAPPASDAKGQSSPRAGTAAIGSCRAPGYSRRWIGADTGVPLVRSLLRQVSMVRALRLLAAVALVAGVAAACTFPPAEQGAPGLASLDDWVAGRNKIWDLAFPA